MAQSNRPQENEHRPGIRFPRLCVFMAARLDSLQKIDGLVAEVAGGARVISISGLTSISAKAYVLSKVQAATGASFAIVTQTNEEIEAWSCDLEFWSMATNQAPRCI